MAWRVRLGAVGSDAGTGGGEGSVPLRGGRVEGWEGWEERRVDRERPESRALCAIRKGTKAMMKDEG